MSFSLLSKNFVGASRFMTRSFSTRLPLLQQSQRLNLNQYQSALSLPASRLTFSRQFSDTPQVGKEHLKDGLPEQYKWTADNLETYLRNFASKHNIKQEDLDYMIKTFVKGPTSAAEFFQLDRQALAEKIGNTSPERTRIGSLLVADLWKETQAIGSQMQNYGAILVGVAAVIFGAWAYNSMSGDSKDTKKAKDNVKSAAHDAKDSAKSAANSAKDAASNAKDNVKSAASNAKDSAKSAAHDAKDSTKSSVQAMEDKVKSVAHDAKDAVVSGAHNLKDKTMSVAHDAKESVKGKMSDAKDHAKSSAHEVKSAAKDVRDSSKRDTDDAKSKAAGAFKDDGAVGKQFTEKGAIGGTAQKIGGPFDKEGAIGKQFTTDGAIGGKVQEKAEKKEQEYYSRKSKD